MGRYDDVLIFLYGICLTVDMIPPFSFYAMDQHGIVGSLFLFDIVKFYFWEKSDLADIKISDKGIFPVFQ